MTQGKVTAAFEVLHSSNPTVGGWIYGGQRFTRFRRKCVCSTSSEYNGFWGRLSLIFDEYSSIQNVSELSPSVRSHFRSHSPEDPFELLTRKCVFFLHYSSLIILPSSRL